MIRRVKRLLLFAVAGETRRLRVHAQRLVVRDEHRVGRVPPRRRLLGVHIFGERATEIIHIGQAVLAFGGTIDYFRDTVFNYPTMAEAYKVAGLDGLNRL